jgi:hypothetical protein
MATLLVIYDEKIYHTADRNLIKYKNETFLNKKEFFSNKKGWVGIIN